MNRPLCLLFMCDFTTKAANVSRPNLKLEAISCVGVAFVREPVFLALWVFLGDRGFKDLAEYRVNNTVVLYSKVVSKDFYPLKT